MALQAQSHALLTIPKSECCSSNTSLLPGLKCDMFGIRWFCGMGLRSDPYEDKIHFNFSFKWDLWALSQLLDSLCHWSTALPLLQRHHAAPLHPSQKHHHCPDVCQIWAGLRRGKRQLSCTCLDLAQSWPDKHWLTNPSLAG